MTWLVTFRGKDGGRRQDVFEADSREALFNVLADRGISAIGIEEAKDGCPRTAPRGCAKARVVPARLVAWAVVGVLVAASALFIAKCVLKDNVEPVKPPQADKPAKVAEPSIAAPTNLPQATPVEEEDRNSLEWLKKHDKRYIVPEGAVRRANGRLYTKEGRRILEKLPARTIRADGGRKQVFNHQAEREIARLLSIEPGKFFVGNSNYGPRFQQSFAEAVASPTPILDDDDAETAALKREVNEVKADLAQRLKDGEDIVQIMKDAETELRTLATFRNDMMKELTALRFDESVTAQDYKSFVEAANRMLKERGLKGLSSPAFAEAQLKYIREVHKAKQAQKAAREASRQPN